MRTTAIFNLKGGVAKSTTTVNMAAILAEQGQRVLVIDADPQSNTSMFYGFLEDPQRMSLAQLLDADAEARSDLADNYVFDTPVDGVRLVPASMDLIDADISSIRRGGQIRAIRDLLDNLNEDAWVESGVPEGGADAYDVVLIDCPPSVTAASVAASGAFSWMASRVLISIVKPSFAEKRRARSIRSASSSKRSAGSPTQRMRRAAMSSVAAAVAWLWLWSTPMVYRWVGCSLEDEWPAVMAGDAPAADAIVLLGGGMSANTNICRYAEMGIGADRV